MRVEIIVSPRSRKFLLYNKDDVVHADLKSPPENNRANLELIKELKRVIGAEVRVVSGLKSKRKVVEMNITAEKWNSLVNNLAAPG